MATDVPTDAREDLPEAARRVAERDVVLLYRIAQELTSPERHLGPMLRAILGHISAHTGMERGMITVLEPSRDLARVDVSEGLSEAQEQRGLYKIGEGVIGRVLDRGEPAVIPAIGDEPLFLDRTGARQHLDQSRLAFLCVPITSGPEVIGTISVDRRQDARGATLEADLQLLTVVATMVGQAVKQRREQLAESEKVTRETRRAQREAGELAIQNLIGNSKEMNGVIDLIEQVGPTDVTVLIRGESGTGKELIANALHALSERREGPLVAVNCGSIPEHLVESELFGHVRGAFTGALSHRVGKFEAANGGTLFLDEIGDLSPPSQVKLLRALQARVVERVGENRARPIDCRVIAATNANLEKAIEQGKFREDLYYRLNVFPVFVPPLHQRRSDITLLAEHFVAKFAAEHRREVHRISDEAMELMLAYRWPGNVRELENCMSRAVLVSRDGVVRERDLPPSLHGASGGEAARTGNLHDMMMGYEREILVGALRAAQGNQAQAARALGTTARILSYRLRRHGLNGALSLVAGAKGSS